MATLQELFIDMVNAANPDLGLTLADVDFGNPTEYSSGTEGDVRNSALTLTAKGSSVNFRGSKEYHFRRFLFTHPNGEDVPTSLTTDLQSNWDDDDYVLRLFNMMLPNNKLVAAQVTITRGELQPDEGDGPFRDIKLRIDPNHLKWQGAFVWRVFSGKDSLMWKEGELDGFE